MDNFILFLESYLRIGFLYMSISLYLRWDHMKKYPFYVNLLGLAIMVVFYPIFIWKRNAKHGHK